MSNFVKCFLPPLLLFLPCLLLVSQVGGTETQGGKARKGVKDVQNSRMLSFFAVCSLTA